MQPHFVHKAARVPTSAVPPDPPRVLVAEDDAEMRRLVVEALRKDGYDVAGVADGGRLLVALARHMVAPQGENAVDLVVSDIRMPICTGLQLLEQVRAAHWRMPFILMTAFGDLATRNQALSLHAFLLDKPFSMDDLRSAAAKVLDGRCMSFAPPG